MEDKKIIVATANKDKLREIRELLLGFKIIGYKEMGIDIEIEENGNSFFENALIKAKKIFEITGEPTLADDSGICVQALFNAPGIYSARYAGDGVAEHNNQKLLKELENEDNRKAKYVCQMVYYDGKSIKTEIGEMQGEILREKSGNGGFGYDPIFFSYELNKSVGDCSDSEKNTVSHRAKALRKIKERIER